MHWFSGTKGILGLEHTVNIPYCMQHPNHYFYNHTIVFASLLFILSPWLFLFLLYVIYKSDFFNIFMASLQMYHCHFFSTQIHIHPWVLYDPCRWSICGRFNMYICIYSSLIKSWIIFSLLDSRLAYVIWHMAYVYMSNKIWWKLFCVNSSMQSSRRLADFNFTNLEYCSKATL